MASENAGAGDTPSNAPAAPEPTIPDELICSLCRDLLTDAVMIPCCGNSFCDECKGLDITLFLVIVLLYVGNKNCIVLANKKIKNIIMSLIT